MLRVVLDTNIRYSSAFYGGRPREVDVRCEQPLAIQLISKFMVDELERILGRVWSPFAVEAEIRRIRSRSLEIEPHIRITACRDPDDDRVLECAVAGNADYIVTGDKDLLTLNPFRNIAIVTVRQFLDLSIPVTKPLP